MLGSFLRIEYAFKTLGLVALTISYLLLVKIEDFKEKARKKGAA